MMYDLGCMLMVNRDPSWYSMDYRVYMGSSMTVRPLVGYHYTCALINWSVLLQPLWGIPCKGLQRGLRESLRASRYLGKNTRVVDESLHISTLLFSFHIYIAILVCAFVSASSPLVGFGKLNDNIIKGLISLLSVEQEIESIAYTCGLCINKYTQGSTSRQTWWYATLC